MDEVLVFELHPFMATIFNLNDKIKDLFEKHKVIDVFYAKNRY